MFNGTTTDQSFTVEAICGHKPTGYKIVTEQCSFWIRASR